MNIDAPAPRAEVVLPAPDLAATLAFFTEHLGFRLEVLTGADDPESAVVTGFGLRLRLDRDADASPGLLHLHHEGPRTSLRAPNGTRVELFAAQAEVGTDRRAPEWLPPLVASPEIAHADRHATWGTGRAGMQYRDLVPSRLGGYLIASHIRIPGGGPVPDYVHHHHVRFQMIYCARGWVEVVYEDQGPPFVLEAGDCVLQPPHIRHRVLHASPGLEVMEVACPATHDTFVDHDLTLPTLDVVPDRNFGGQRFVRHVAADAARRSWDVPGLVTRDTGIGTATGGWAEVEVVEASHAAAHTPSVTSTRDDDRLTLAVVLDGEVDLTLTDHPAERLRRGSCAVAPPGCTFSWSGWSSDVSVLNLRLRTQA